MSFLVPADLLGRLAEQSLRLEAPTRDDALAVLSLPDDAVLDVVAAAFRVRLRFFGRRLKLNFLINARSGLCPEDCTYCSQRSGSNSDILKYRLVDSDTVMAAASRAVAGGAQRICLVASGRGPSSKDVAHLAQTVRTLRESYPAVEVCTSLGLLDDDKASALHQAGVMAYNHNLNTSERFYESICSTHTYTDRVDVASVARSAELSVCSGAIFGLSPPPSRCASAAPAPPSPPMSRNSSVWAQVPGSVG